MLRHLIALRADLSRVLLYLKFRAVAGNRRQNVLTDFEVLGLEGQVLGLEASSPRKLACPRLEDSSIF